MSEVAPIKPRKSKLNRITLWDVILVLFFILLSALFFYPIWYCVVRALTGMSYNGAPPLFIPRAVTLEAFEFVFKDADIMRYYGNTLLYAFGGTFVSLLLTCMMAYPFVINDFKGKKILNIFMVITMFFSGGLIPTYYLISGLGMRNTIWVMIIPGAVGAYDTIVFRTFFKSVPDSLREAAYIDGAGHYRVLFSMMIPLSKALLATFGLFGLVGRWNDWFTPFIYLSRDSLKPMALYLRSTLVVAETQSADFTSLFATYQNIKAENVRCAAVLITIIPIMCVYPFLQKYFAQGTLIGAVKA